MIKQLVLLALVVNSSGLISSGAVVRQETIGQHKTVVYSGACASLPQLVKTTYNLTPTTPGQWNKIYWSVITIPEFNTTIMPQVSVYGYFGGNDTAPAGWGDADWAVANGVVYVLWKHVNRYARWEYDPETETDYIAGYELDEHVQSSLFKIVLTYAAETSVAAKNTGTGKSVELNITTDEETTKKIRGYKVYRRKASDE